MLQSIRSHAGSWFIKFLLVAIIASFALWGSSEMIHNYGHSRPVATVGNRSISVEEFADAYKKAIANIQARIKKALTPEEIKDLGIAKKVLDSLIYKAGLEQDLKHLGVTTSDQAVRNEIHAIPSFLNKKGQFDKNAFAQILRAQGLSEGQFLKEVRREMEEHQFFTGITAGLGFSDTYLRMLHQALEQNFQFVAIDIPFKKMALPKAPTESEIARFFEEHKEAFRQPERRELSLLKFDRDALKSRIQVSEDELKEEYNRRAEELSSPEKHHIESLLLSSDALARKAVGMIESGKPIKTIARELKAPYKDYETLTKDEFPAEYAEKVFALNEGKTEIIETPKGWIVFYVERIDAPSSEPFEKVRDRLENDIKLTRFNAFFEQLQYQVEDALAGGEGIEDIAKKNGLTLEKISDIDAAGRDINHKEMIDPAVREEALTFTFSNAKGSDSNVILAKGSDSKIVAVIVHIDDIKESYTPNLSEIKGKVTEAYKNKIQQDIAFTTAKEMAQNIRFAKDMDALAKAKGFTFSTLPPISRGSVDQNQSFKAEFSNDMIEQIFALSKGEPLIAPTKAGFKILFLEKALPYTPNEEKFTKFKEVMVNMLGKDFMQANKEQILRAYPVTMNQTQVDHVIGHS